jgi:hypothetical protein
MIRFRCAGCFVLLMLFLAAIPLSAQNFTSDARLVAMGGIGGHANDSLRLAGDARSYRTIGIPLGLIQVFKNTNVFRPDTDEFNPLHAMELLASPLHYTFDRHESGPGETLVRDLVNGRISRDLNSYRGFQPQAKYDTMGLVAPSFGKTIRVRGSKDTPYQGFYVGAGPYLAIGTNLDVDQRLIDLLGASSNTYLPNTTFLIGNTTDGQAAAAITAGYRARFGLPVSVGTTSERDGVYVSANYNYLHGLRYESASMGVRFDTDNAGLITLAPATIPLTVNHTWSSKGTGFAIDLGTTVVINHWDLNFAANGLGNRIDWDERESERFTLSSLLQGLEFTQSPLPNPAGKQRIELPVQYLGGAAYNTERWTASSQISHGLQDLEFRGGAEYRLVIFEFRGGGHYKQDKWQPAGGVGLNITRGFGIDAAVYGAATNIEKKRKAAFALSLRLGSK